MRKGFKTVAINFDSEILYSHLLISGVTVVRSTPDRKVVFANQLGFIAYAFLHLYKLVLLKSKF